MSFAIPALLIWGAEDKVLHIDNAELFRRELQNCTEVVIRESGHAPMVGKPGQTAGQILNHLSNVGL